MPPAPSAVLLDVGGVFLLPSRAHIRSAMARIDHPVGEDETIDRAHFVAARAFPMDLDATDDLIPYWDEYLKAYAIELDVPNEILDEAVEHLRNEYVTGGLWSQVVEGSQDGLAHLVATGVPVGIVSNSDGTIGRRLHEMGILQVGPGPGVEVQCLIDSGSVGVEKPSPEIFGFALESMQVEPEGVWYVGDTPGFDMVGARRAGLDPILMDPFGVNEDMGVRRVRNLNDVAELLAT